MGRAHETFNKKEINKKKRKKREDKEKRRQERKENKESNSLDDMIAYVDELGNITSTPPDLSKKEEIAAEDIEVAVPKTSHSDNNELKNTGIVNFFDTEKGFGFIKDSETRRDIFVHANGLIDSIKENDHVKYDIVKGQKGPNAVNVELNKE